MTSRRISIATLAALLAACDQPSPPLPPIDPAVRTLFPADPDGRWGYIDRAGTMRIPPRFELACDFSEGLAAVMSDRKYGFIDEKGDWVLPPAYDLAGRFVDDRAAVKLGERWGFVDRKGAFTQAPERGVQKTPSLAERGVSGLWFAGTSEGLATFESNRRYGYRTLAGRTAIGPAFEMASDFRGGLAGVVVNADLRYIDREGRTVWEPRYSLTPSPSDWAFSKDEASFEASRRRLKGGWEAAAEPDGTGDRFIRILRNGEAVYVFRGHDQTVFDVKGDVLTYAHFSPRTCGCTIVAVDLSSGRTLWRTRLRAAGDISHSLYSNFVNLRVEGDRVIVCGDEWRNYVEVLDAVSGRILGHLILEPTP